MSKCDLHPEPERFRFSWTPDNVQNALDHARLFLDEARKRDVDNRVLQERTLKALSRRL